MPKKTRPTFEMFRAAITHSKDMSEDEKALGLAIFAGMEAKVIRLIQIQDEVKKLEAEAGYTDQHSGVRHPGLKDEIEKLFIKFDLFDGVKVEDFDVTIQTGKAPDHIDPIELLRQGVTEAQIKAATKVGKSWTTIRCQRRQSKDKEQL